jgi:hypothetical protein
MEWITMTLAKLDTTFLGLDFYPTVSVIPTQAGMTETVGDLGINIQEESIPATSLF